MTEKMTDTTVTKWLDITALCNRFERSTQQVGNIARCYSQHVAAATIEFEIDGVTVRKVGKGKTARYKIISGSASCNMSSHSHAFLIDSMSLGK